MFKSKFYIAFVVILILIAGLSWVAVALETNEVEPQPTVEQWKPKEKMLTPTQVLGKEVFWENCFSCHQINRDDGGRIIYMAVNGYEENHLKRFLAGDRSRLHYAENYEGMICPKPKPALTQEEINQLIDFLNTLK